MNTHASARSTVQRASEESHAPTRLTHSREQTSPGVWMREYGQAIKNLDTTGGPGLRTLTQPGWKEQGVCATVEPEVWFSEGRTSRTRRALGLCEDCPVRRHCLAFALVFREEFGVWGGLAVSDRRPLEARLVNGEPLGEVLACALDTRTSAVRGAA